MKHIGTLFIQILLGLAILCGCSSEKTPSRDHIPIIKANLSKLQSAVREKNNAAIDSLLSVKMLDYQQDADSLLNLVYGAEGNFAFELFGLPEIIYTEKIAKVECFVMDSSGNTTRPLTLTFINDDGLWLLSRFEDTIRPRESL